MEQDPTRICELLVGLGDVDVVGVVDEATEPLVVRIQTRSRPVWGLRRVGVVQRHQFGAVGGFAGVRGGRCAWCGTSIAGSARPQIV